MSINLTLDQTSSQLPVKNNILPEKRNPQDLESKTSLTIQNDCIQIGSSSTLSANTKREDYDHIDVVTAPVPKDSIDRINAEQNVGQIQQQAYSLENIKVDCVEQEYIENKGMDQIAIKQKQSTCVQISQNEQDLTRDTLTKDSGRYSKIADEQASKSSVLQESAIEDGQDGYQDNIVEANLCKLNSKSQELQSSGQKPQQLDGSTTGPNLGSGIEDKAKIQISISLAGVQSGCSSGTMTTTILPGHTSQMENQLKNDYDNQGHEVSNNKTMSKNGRAPSVQVRNRPQRENRKKPSHFGFNYCHCCRRTESIDDLIRCKKEDCPNFFCYNCLRKSKQKKAPEYPQSAIFPKCEFQKLKESPTFQCLSCKGQCPCPSCDENSLFNDVRMLQLGIQEDAQNQSPPVQLVNQTQEQSSKVVLQLQNFKSPVPSKTGNAKITPISQAKVAGSDQKEQSTTVISNQTDSQKVQPSAATIHVKQNLFSGLKIDQLLSMQEASIHKEQQSKLNQRNEERKIDKNGRLCRQSKTQAILATKALIHSEKSDEDNDGSKRTQKVSVTSSGRASKKPKSREEYIEDFEEIEEDDDNEDEEADDESEYSEADALKDEIHIKSDASWDPETLNYDQVKRNLLKVPGTVDISQKFTSIKPLKDRSEQQSSFGQIGHQPSLQNDFMGLHNMINAQTTIAKTNNNKSQEVQNNNNQQQQQLQYTLQQLAQYQMNPFAAGPQMSQLYNPLIGLDPYQLQLMQMQMQQQPMYMPQLDPLANLYQQQYLNQLQYLQQQQQNQGSLLDLSQQAPYLLAQLPGIDQKTQLQLMSQQQQQQQQQQHQQLQQQFSPNQNELMAQQQNLNLIEQLSQNIKQLSSNLYDSKQQNNQLQAQQQALYNQPSMIDAQTLMMLNMQHQMQQQQQTSGLTEQQKQMLMNSNGNIDPSQYQNFQALLELSQQQPSMQQQLQLGNGNYQQELDLQKMAGMLYQNQFFQQ